MEEETKEDDEKKSLGRYKTLKFSHSELLEITNRTLANLIACDSVLSDLPPDPTVDEITSQLALHHGQSITVYVKKDTGEKLPIVVRHGATVGDLKRAIKHYITLSMKRDGDKTKISWHYIWKDNNLKSETGGILSDDRASLSNYDIVNGSEVAFVKKLRQKNKIEN